MIELWTCVNLDTEDVFVYIMILISKDNLTIRYIKCKLEQKSDWFVETYKYAETS